MGTDLSSTSEEMSKFAESVYRDKYAWGDETWPDTAHRVTKFIMGSLGYQRGTYEFDRMYEFIRDRKFLPGGRYLYATGRQLHQVNNCLLMRCEDSREGWSELVRNAMMALQTGAGIGVDYSDVRASGTPIKKTGGTASGPLSPAKIVNEVGRNVMQGGSRRSAIWAGLNWKHADIFKWIQSKDWPEVVVKAKETDYTFPGDLDMTNISILIDDDFFSAMKDSSFRRYDEKGLEIFASDEGTWHDWAVRVYDRGVRMMISTAEPGFSVDIQENAGETLRNACTEITSADDSDVCNLGSINLARVDSKEEFEELVKLGTLFLLGGTIYSHVPYKKVDEIRRKNRRLGLGLMGIHEWLVKRGKPYGPDNELAEWLDIYATSDDAARHYAKKHILSPPVKTRAIAPTGTIGIVAETTTGIEPIFCAAYKRRIREASPDGDITRYTIVIDPTAKRLIEAGVDPLTIEDAYTLSYDVERRVRMQAWVQKWVDHGISSTINLPYPITDEDEVQDFKNMLIGYLPHLRGVTAYPNGAISGQPLEPVGLEYALNHEGEIVYETEENICRNGVCGV